MCKPGPTFPIEWLWEKCSEEAAVEALPQCREGEASLRGIVMVPTAWGWTWQVSGVRSFFYVPLSQWGVALQWLES